jgi:hypothetical protein
MDESGGAKLPPPPPSPGSEGKLSQLAVGSLVAGILSFWPLILVGSVIGVSLGIGARRSIRASGDRLRGMKMARAGIILRVVSITLYVAFVSLLFIGCSGDRGCA